MDENELRDNNCKGNKVIKYKSNSHEDGYNIIGKIRNIYDKYCEAGKRKLFWSVIVKHTNNFDSYEEYKEYWNSDTSIRKEFKLFIKDEVENF